MCFVVLLVYMTKICTMTWGWRGWLKKRLVDLIWRYPLRRWRAWTGQLGYWWRSSRRPHHHTQKNGPCPGAGRAERARTIRWIPRVCVRRAQIQNRLPSPGFSYMPGRTYVSRARVLGEPVRVAGQLASTRQLMVTKQVWWTSSMMPMAFTSPSTAGSIYKTLVFLDGTLKPTGA